MRDCVLNGSEAEGCLTLPFLDLFLDGGDLPRQGGFGSLDVFVQQIEALGRAQSGTDHEGAQSGWQRHCSFC